MPNYSVGAQYALTYDTLLSWTASTWELWAYLINSHFPSMPNSLSSVNAHMITPIGWLVSVLIVWELTVHRWYYRYLEGKMQMRHNHPQQSNPCLDDQEFQWPCKLEAKNKLIGELNKSIYGLYRNMYSEIEGPYAWWEMQMDTIPVTKIAWNHK